MPHPFRSHFRIKPFLLFIALFLIEIIIALFVRDSLIRPYGGDFIALIMLYALLKSFLNIHPKTLLPFALLIAYAIEISQHFNLVSILGLSHNRVAVIIFGNAFSWGDMIAYTLGALTCALVELMIARRKTMTITHKKSA